LRQNFKSASRVLRSIDSLVQVKTYLSRAILILVAFVSLAAAWVYGRLSYDASVERYLASALPNATKFQLLCFDSGEKLCLFEGYSGQNGVIGYVAAVEGRGYGGPMTIVVGWSKEGTLLTLSVPKHKEDAPWFRILENRGFLEQYIGRKDTDSLELTRDIDAVSGATVSSYGVAEGVLKARELVAKQLGHTIPARVAPTVKLGLAEKLLLLGFGWVVGVRAGRFFAGKKWRRVPSLVFGFFVLGIWLGQPLSLVNFTAWLVGYPPPLHNNVLLYVLVLGVIALAVALGRNFYCFWLCPFAAVQEGAHLITGSSIQPDEVCRKRLVGVRYLLLWLALFLAFMFRLPSLTVYEPWTALFTLKGTEVQWALVAVTLVGAMLVHNLWCTYLCPVGALLEVVLKARSRVTSIFRAKKE
jgi:NosR/NirI family transcriptional regulator, nitrous oxide reductase regulator